jgi:ABC-2 type transport system ATP-binding protein
MHTKSDNGFLVQVTGLTKSFKRANGERFYAVREVDLHIRRGEIFSLLGPNGAGKTTTISMISGLLAPDAGEALIGGHSIIREPLQAKRLIGIVPQEIALYPALSARQNLEFFGRMYGMYGAALRRAVDEVLELIDLTDRQHDKVERFSGGMKRRVNIGAGLLHKPQLIYMDEPTVGIDPQNRRRILDTVLRLRDEMQMTVLYTSHLMEEVQEISDRVGIIDHGQMIALGTVGELIQSVGEEDRLILRVNAPSVDEALLRRFETDVPTATRAQFTPITPAEPHENGGGIPVSEGTLTIYAARGRRALPDIIRIANEAGLEIASVEVREPDLEAVFLHTTGRALRD